jgi:hypothetical protein
MNDDRDMATGLRAGAGTATAGDHLGHAPVRTEAE